jgi:hypothetical protein
MHPQFINWLEQQSYMCKRETKPGHWIVKTEHNNSKIDTYSIPVPWQFVCKWFQHESTI